MAKKFKKKKPAYISVEKKAEEQIAAEETVVESVEVVNNTPKKRKFPQIKISKRLFIYTSAAVLFLTALAASGFFYLKYQDALRLSTETNASSSKETEKLVSQVGKIVELPQSETPTIATVSDINALSGQDFFKNAKNGDKVLIYQGAGIAYLFRPENGKLVNLGPVSAQGEVAGASNSATTRPSVTPAEESEPAKIVILNGTTTTGLTRTAEAELLNENIVVDVVDRDNAASSEYEETVVVVFTDTQKDQAEKIATAIGGQVIPSLPDGEVRPDADILIILGSNYSN